MKPDARREDELARLDALLDELPDPREPMGLAERVLAATAAERQGVRPRPVRPWWIAAALAAAAAVALWFGWSRGGDGPAPGGRTEQIADLPADAALLRELELLEDWELLVTDDLALLLAELDEVDEALIDEALSEDPDGEEVEQG